MAFSAYSLTPSANVTIGAVSVAEGCPPGNVNDAIRQLAADGKDLANTVGGISTAGLMPLTGGAFLGQITRSGKGGYLFNANSAQGGGQVSILATGTALPTSPTEGDIVFFY